MFEVKVIINEKEFMLNKKSSKPDMQIGKTSISGESPSFPVEPQLSIGSRANQILLQNDIEYQALILTDDCLAVKKRCAGNKTNS